MRRRYRRRRSGCCLLSKPDDFPSDVLQEWKDDREGAGVAALRGLDGVTEERLEELIRDALAGSRGSIAELDWKLTEDEYEERAANLLRDADDITLKRFLRSAVGAWRIQIELPEGSETQLTTILDRLICLAAWAVRWGRGEPAVEVLRALEAMYDAVLTEPEPSGRTS